MVRNSWRYSNVAFKNIEESFDDTSGQLASTIGIKDEAVV